MELIIKPCPLAARKCCALSTASFSSVQESITSFSSVQFIHMCATAACSRQSRAESRFFRGGVGVGAVEASYAHRRQRNAAPRWEAP